MAFRMGLVGKKVGMTQLFDEKGDWIPVSVVEVQPNVVIEKKSSGKHGYDALRLGAVEKRQTRVNRAMQGVFSAAKTTPKHVVREVRLPAADLEQFEVGQSVRAEQVFRAGQAVDLIGVSKGKGFQGVMKRHNFGGFRASHGTHEYFRHGGSVGCRLTPGRIHKGKRMCGHMGDDNVTVQNISIYRIIPEKNLVLLRGAVPGAPDAVVTIRWATKRPTIPFKLITEPVLAVKSGRAAESDAPEKADKAKKAAKK